MSNIIFEAFSTRPLDLKDIYFPQLVFHKIFLLQSCVNFDYLKISYLNENKQFLMQMLCF